MVGRLGGPGLRSRSRGLQGGHFGNEAEPPAMNGADHLLSRTIVAHRLPR